VSQRFDAVVIGTGPAGEVAASRLPKLGLRTALVERELVGGECAYWACIPSKTLLRPPEARSEARHAAGLGEPEQRWSDIVAYRDYMTRILDDGAVKGYEDYGVNVYKGEARITAPGRIEVGGQELEAERIVIATERSVRPGDRWPRGGQLLDQPRGHPAAGGPRSAGAATTFEGLVRTGSWRFDSRRSRQKPLVRRLSLRDQLCPLQQTVSA